MKLRYSGHNRHGVLVTAGGGWSWNEVEDVAAWAQEKFAQGWLDLSAVDESSREVAGIGHNVSTGERAWYVVGTRARDVA